MALGSHLASIAVAAALLWPAPAGAAPAFPAHEVRIAVSIADAGTASVVETYALEEAAAPGAAFEFLDRPCATVGAIAASADGGRSLILASGRHGPWTTLTTAAAAPRGPIVMRYDVRPAGGDEAAIPIVLPDAPLQTAPGLRGSDVVVRVAFAGALARRGAVVLPRLDRAGEPGVWAARLLAMPSVVTVRLPNGRRGGCDERLAGSSGGLEWRFWIFVLTMAVWVPIYFWWFSRGDRAA